MTKLTQLQTAGQLFRMRIKHSSQEVFTTEEVYRRLARVIDELPILRW